MMNIAAADCHVKNAHDPARCARGPDCIHCAELATLDAPQSPPDPDEERLLLDTDPRLWDTRDRNPCRGHPCPSSPCDRCSAWWTYCRLLIHRHRQSHIDRERLVQLLRDLRRMAEVYPDAIAEALTPIIVPMAVIVAREVNRG